MLEMLYAEFSVPGPGVPVALRGSVRWQQKIETTPLPAARPEELPIVDEGVYLVTGGLGGIGFVLAGHLAKNYRARLVLTRRSPFPKREEWDEWLETNGAEDLVSRKILTLRQWEEAGAKVSIYAADASDMKQMSEVVSGAVEQFGGLNGIIHSAGLGDYTGVIQRRAREAGEPVLAPKVRGTLVLDTLLREMDMEPDFIVLCSSLASVIGPFGQVGYCAANRFLDVYAHYKNTVDGVFTVSVNWDSWQEVGMAVEAVRRMAGIAGPVEKRAADSSIKHPFFNHRIEDSGGCTYVSYMSTRSHWVLDEHRIMGIAAMPGTGYLEMARAACGDFTGSDRLVMRDVLFLTPLSLSGDDEEREVHTVLETDGGGFTYSIRSRRWGLAEEWQEHSRGFIGPMDDAVAPAGPESLEKILEACNEEVVEIPEGEKDYSGHIVQAGPRWDNLRRTHYGANEGLAFFALPEAFAGDVEDYLLHPAVLDCATSFLMGVYRGNDSYLPFSYKRIAIVAPLPVKVYAHCRYKAEEAGNTIVYDIDILDEEGNRLVAIESYTLVKVASGRAPSAPSALPGESGETVETAAPMGEQPAAAAPVSPEMEILRNAIRPDEGIEAFRRILSAPLSQVLVSTVDFHNYYRQARRRDRGEEGVEMESAMARPTRAGRPRPELSTPFAEPVNDTQRKLAEIWREFLGIEGIGIYDDFFELGGDSLKAVTFAARLHKELNVELPVGEIFNSPTIGKLSEYISGAEESIYSSIEPVEEKEYYPLSSAQKRMFVLHGMKGDNTSDNTPMVMELDGDLDRQLFEETVRKLIRRHESFRTSFHLLGKDAVQRVHRDVDFELEYHDLSGVEGDTGARTQAIVHRFIRVFDLGEAPLLRVGMIKLAENRHVFMFDMHHIIRDVVSSGIFIREFWQVYGGETLPPLRLQYKDFAAWQNDLIHSEDISGQAAYWLERFSGELPVLNLPTDYPRPAVQSFEGRAVLFDLEMPVVRKVKEMVKETGATTYMVLLAVYTILLSKYSGQEDIVVGTPIAGRPHEDLQNIVGMFVNTLALRNYPTGDKTFLRFLEEVKTGCLDAYSNQDYQFETLVEALGIERDRSRNPLFDTMLAIETSDEPSGAAMLEASAGAMEAAHQESQASETGGPAGGLAFKPYDFEEDITQFDMITHAMESPDSIAFKMRYCTKLFKQDTMDQFINHWKEIISIVTEQQEIQIKDIKIAHDLAEAKVEMPDTGFVF